MSKTGADMQTMKEWGELFANREIAPLPIYTMQRQWKAARLLASGTTRSTTKTGI